MPTFLDQFLDGETVEPGQWTPDEETTEQHDRLQYELVTVMHAKNMKRRLGPDASPPELSADKKIAKMVFNRLLTVYESWGGSLDTVLLLYAEAGRADADEAKAQLLINGAQIDWDAFWQAKKAYLQSRVRLMAANAVANNERKNGNRFANRFVNEYNSISDVLAPVDGTDREHKFDAI